MKVVVCLSWREIGAVVSQSRGAIKIVDIPFWREVGTGGCVGVGTFGVAS